MVEPAQQEGPASAPVVLIARFLNAIVHVGETVVLRRYVPGVATAPTNALAAGLLLRRDSRVTSGQ